MSLQLDKIDPAPIISAGMPFEFMQWIWVLIDSLNENIDDLNKVVSSVFVVPTPSPVVITTQTVDINTAYIPTNTMLSNFQLPDTVPVGVRVEIDGQGSGGWKLLVGSGQTIQLAVTGSTASTSVASSSQYDSISIICVVENKTWIVVSQSTAGFVIV